ncbi:MAG TPA: glycerophosphodiester phosphodiesterase family protein [Egibacteraceae bacterium]|nr:glycerophosphodiester phosphodiesterase family protein [Egibacteraceae bacterium]
MAATPTAGSDRPPPRRRGWFTVVVLLAGAAVAALLQAAPTERIPHFVERAPVNIAHAGAQGHAPENTMPAFTRAVELGADVLEMDLQLTADDVVVLMHDATVDRTTGGTGRVRDLTLAEIKALEAGHDFPGPHGDYPFVGQGVEVPTLAEVFDAFPDEWLLLEMKPDSGPEILPALVALIEAHGRQRRTVVASFDRDLLLGLREAIPGIPTNLPESEGFTFVVLQLVGAHRWWTPPWEFLKVPTTWDLTNPIAWEAFPVVTPGFVRAAEHRGIDVNVWTINEPEEMHRLLNLGVHGILTDYPDRFGEVLAERAAAAFERADPGLHPRLGFVQRLQDRLDWLTPVMAAVTWLGDEEFYVLVFPMVLWSVHRAVGIQLAVLFLLSASLNEIAKLAARTPRPSFLDPSLALRAESTFGVPSGHAQNAVVVWGYLAAAIRRWWAWAAAVVLMALLGVSRLQLGVHFPVDTIVGWVVGAVLLAAYLRWRETVTARVAALDPRRQLRLAFAASLGLIALAVLVRVAFVGWALPARWIGVDPLHHPMQTSRVVTPAATLFGVAAGLVFLRNRGGFTTDGPVWKRALRVPVGLVGVVALWFGLGELFPGGEDPIALAYRYLRYAAVGMWAGGVAPVLFVRLGLAAGDPAFTADPPVPRTPVAVG